MKNLAIFISMLIVSNLFSQKSSVTIKTIDLAFGQNNKIESIEPGSYVFRFINYAPSGVYDTISVEVVNQKIEVLPAVIKGVSLPGGDMFIEASNKFFKDEDCLLDSLYQELMKLTDEFEVKKFYSSIDFENIGCNNRNVVLFKLKFQQATTWESDTFTVKKGQDIEIVVKRIIDSDNSKIKNWKFKTPKKGEWVTSYGLNIVSRWTSSEQHYFSSRIQGDTTYVIKKERNKEKANFSASAFFTYIPNNEKSVPAAFTAGIGTDTDNLSLYLGGSAVIHTNIMINIGFAGHLKYDLLGEYIEGQTIYEDLDFNQLHKKVVSVNPFIGLSFRFGENPFSKKED